MSKSNSESSRFSSQRTQRTDDSGIKTKKGKLEPPVIQYTTDDGLNIKCVSSKKKKTTCLKNEEIREIFLLWRTFRALTLE